MSVYKKEKYKILQLALDKPQINAIVNKAGKANWDIAKVDSTKPTEAQQESNFSLTIKKYAIKGGIVNHEDFEGKTFAYINNLDFEGSGDVSSAIYDFDTKTAIDKLTISSGAITYLNKAKIKAENKLSINQTNNIYTFKDNQIQVNDLALLFDGFFKINKSDYSVDIKFKSKEASFKSILSLIPAVYKKDFDNIKTSGTLALDGSAKGLYSEKTYPEMNLNLMFTNGMFQYPS